VATPQEAAEALALGRDVYSSADRLVTGSGGYALAEGLANLRLALWRLLITAPGELYHRPDYGIGIRRHLNQPMGAARMRELRTEIIAQVAKDPRISKVVNVSLSLDASGVLAVGIEVEASARRSSFVFTFQP
jgi:phage baseplate assembly protein W